MSLARLMTDTGTIVRAAQVANRFGGTDLDWDNATEVDTLCWLSDGSSSEIIDGRDALVSSFRLYLPPDADITGRDRFRKNGITYLVDGAITTAARPGKGVHHLEAALKLVEG